MTGIQLIQLFLTLFFCGILVLVINFGISSLIGMILFLLSNERRNALNECWCLIASLCMMCAASYIIWMINCVFMCRCSLTIPQHISLAFIPLAAGYIIVRFIDKCYEGTKNQDLLLRAVGMREGRDNGDK